MKTNPDDPTAEPTPDLASDPTSESETIEIVQAGNSLSKSQEVDDLVKLTARILRQGMQSSRRGLKEILEGALHLIDLQLRHSAQGTRNDLLPCGKKSGFQRVLDEVGMPSSTAYRWIQIVRPYITACGITDSNFPVPDSDEWVRMVKSMKRSIEQFGGLGLPIRAIPVPKDEEVMTRLRAAAAVGDKEARELLRQLEAGEITLEEATHRYCQIEGGAKRPIPALVKLNSKSLQPEGPAIKALGVVEELFLRWNQFPDHVKIQARARIREVLVKLPQDCRFHAD